MANTIVQGQPFTPDSSIGVDLCLTSADVPGDLAVTQGGDLQLIGNTTPLLNLWQATILRLITTLGTYLFASPYGTKARQFIDQPETQALQQQLQTEISNTIMADPRIKQINTLTVVQSDSNPQGYVVTLNFTAVSSNQVVGGIFTIQAENPPGQNFPGFAGYAFWDHFKWDDGSVYWE